MKTTFVIISAVFLLLVLWFDIGASKGTRPPSLPYYACGAIMPEPVVETGNTADSGNVFGPGTNDRQKFVGSRRYWYRQVLKVYFFDGVDERRTEAINIANEWGYGKELVKFIITASRAESDIRVCFRRGGGYKSVVGTEALSIDDSLPTMWLERLDLIHDKVKFRQVVLHEFGHALGLMHELQNPENPIAWNKPVVYAFFLKQYGWKPPLVDANIFNALDPKTVDYSDYDRYSIMNYWIPDSLTTNFKGVPLSTKISLTDFEKFELLCTLKI